MQVNTLSNNIEIDTLSKYKTEKNQTYLCHLICVLVCYAPILHFINGVFNSFGVSNFIWDSLFAYCLILLLMFNCLFFTLNYFKFDTYLMATFFVLAYFITYLLYPENIASRKMYGQSYVVTCFLINLSIYYYARYIVDYKKFYTLLVKYSYFVVILSIANYFISNINDHPGEYMTFSYSMLPAVALLLLEMMHHKKIFAGILGIIGSIFIFIVGARGPVVCLGVLVCMYIVFGNKKLSTKILYTILILLVVVLVYIYFVDIIKILVNITESMGINSRTLTKIIEQDMMDTSANLRLEGYSLISSNFNVFGHGLWGEWILINIYAHNIEIEILYQYGILFGSIILIGLMLFMLQGLLTKNIYLRMLIIVMFSCSFIKMQVTGSYLNSEPVFYLMLALCANAIEYKKEKKYIIENSIIESSVEKIYD